jgi:hypothetical protein
LSFNDFHYLHLGFGVVDVREIPGKQVVHARGRRDGNM